MSTAGEVVASELQTHQVRLLPGGGAEQDPRHWWDLITKASSRLMGPERTFGTGVIVDTMEVAGLWSAVPRLYESIRAALAAHAQAVACHLSHLYPSGSSLYFTFLVRGSDDHGGASGGVVWSNARAWQASSLLSPACA